MKKTLAVLVMLVLLLSLPLAAFADDEVYTEGTLYYTIDNESITIVGCFGKKTEITVPASIAGLPVNAIASGAFVGNKYLQILNLPDTITDVEDGAIDGGISVVYNCNTEYPSLVPTDLIRGVMPQGVPASESAEDETYTPAEPVAELPPVVEQQIQPQEEQPATEIDEGANDGAANAPAANAGTANDGASAPVYNFNVTYPSEFTTDQSYAAASQSGSSSSNTKSTSSASTQTSQPAVGSGEAVIESDDAAPVSEPGSYVVPNSGGTVVAEADVDLDMLEAEEEAEAVKAKPTPTPTPSPSPSPTPTPSPSPTPTPEPEQSGSSGSTIVLILVAVAVIAAWLVLRQRNKKGEK